VVPRLPPADRASAEPLSAHARGSLRPGRSGTRASRSPPLPLRDARLRAPDLHRAPRALRGPVRPAHDSSTTEDAAAFTLLDRAPSLPCLRPWLDAASPRLRELCFGRVLHLGSLAAIERVALEGGVAVLPAPLVARHLESDALRPVFAAMQPSVAPRGACPAGGVVDGGLWRADGTSRAV